MRRDSLSLEQFRERLARAEALPQLALMGLVTGGLTAGVVMLFHLLITWPLTFSLPQGDSESFEALPPWLRLLLPIAGALLIALILKRLPAAQRQVGIPHVLERLSYHQGQLPLPNALTQFFAGALPLLSGHSAGREGPAVHLGAATASLLGQYCHLPLNSIRTLVGCGTAAAISASFNTPIAGVVFAMEVVLMEYSVTGFTPIIIAAFTAALVMQLVFDDYTAFNLPPMDIQSLAEVPFILLLGCAIGLLGILFTRIMRLTQQQAPAGLTARMLLAGLLTGLLALPLPQIMGIGYDTLYSMLDGALPLALLLALVAAKLVATAVSVGLGVPMGLIGPSLFIGAAAGGALGIIGAAFTDQAVGDSGFYALIGMAAMMGALLQAPLAALMAILELTNNPHTLFPAMLAVIAASFTYRQLGGLQPVFIALLEGRGQNWRRKALDAMLNQTGVSSLMDSSLSYHRDATISLAAAQLLEADKRWVLVDGEARCAALAANDLAVYLQDLSPSDSINLLDIPALRREVGKIPDNATLRQALDRMNSGNLDTLLVKDPEGQPLGLVFREDIQRYYARAPL